ncbi:ABC transporter ATP-binding protein [Chitinasiproducens palmae]|uniref:Amino acid/amide ABC transporter ATP-binding protein 1, HAAT family n=1 Tax=Chitinasiproducens palmae TaxID=1770053 RepID=A0A1H2PQC1_9BURK|nr:ABC transporter ATP-binding protein [Chitinasiproducens palmae]SDV49022.1 amino acid/amide ABC transporter ATP-binding protein 1, HAAT family [Chitinasiproducens palmae]
MTAFPASAPAAAATPQAGPAADGDAAPQAARAPLLAVRQLGKRFGGLQAVSDVTLELHAGIVTTLIGPNGAGKTTLFNLITGHLTPTSGDVLYEGKSIAGQSPWRIARSGVGRTFQDLRLFSRMSVEENVLTAMEHSAWLWQPGGRAARRTRAERVAQILEMTHLSALADARAIDLAYAERKFLSIARLIASDARIWLLDEPASGLDPRSYDRFVGLLRSQVAQGVTVCIIEHNLDVVSNVSDRVAFLDQGRLLAEGTPREVLDDPRLASIYFGETA